MIENDLTIEDIKGLAIIFIAAKFAEYSAHSVPNVIGEIQRSAIDEFVEFLSSDKVRALRGADDD